jgi:hypothetical protein
LSVLSVSVFCFSFDNCISPVEKMGSYGVALARMRQMVS